MSVRYTKRELTRRRVGFWLCTITGFLAMVGGYLAGPKIGPFLFMAAGALFATAAVQASPWASGEVESRSVKRDRGGW